MAHIGGAAFPSSVDRNSGKDMVSPIEAGKVVNLNRLTADEIQKFVSGQGANVKRDVWDKIKDFFRTETKQDTIEQLLKEMHNIDSSWDNKLYLENFEKIISHAKPEELHRFRVDVQETEMEGKRWFVQCSIGQQQFDPVEFNLSAETAGHVHAYGALYKLRAALSDPRSELARVQSDWTLSEKLETVQSLIKSSLDDRMAGTRGRYGEFFRRLEADVVSAEGSRNPFYDPSSPLTPILQAAEESGAMKALRSIDAVLVDKAGPREDVAALALDGHPADRVQVGQLLSRDADFSGASIQRLAGAHAKFDGVTLRQLLDRGADFTGANLIKLLANGASLQDTSLSELMGKGVKGGGYPIFPPSGEDPLPPHRLVLYATDREPKLKVADVLAAGFILSGDSNEVSITRVAGQFDLQNCPLALLEFNKVDCFGAGVKELHDLGVVFGGKRAADLATKHMSFAELTAEQVAGLGIVLNDASVAMLSVRGLKVSGTHVSALLDRHASFHGVQFKQLLAADCSCEKVDVRALRASGMSFTDATLEDLTNGKVLLKGMAAEELLEWLGAGAVQNTSVQVLIDAEVAAANESASPRRDISLITLLGNGMTLAGVRIGDLRKWDPGLYGCHVQTLINETDFAGASLKWLKDRGASFAGLNCAALRAAKCDFSELVPGDLAELGKDFFKGTSLTELILAPDVKFPVADLLRSGAELEDVSVATLLQRNVRLDGVNLKDLIKGEADFKGLGIADLQKLENLGLKFDGTNIADLYRAEVVLRGVEITKLPKAIRFDRVNGLSAIERGLSLTSKNDQEDFEARGGTLLQRQERVSEVQKPPQARRPSETQKPAEARRPAEAPKPSAESRDAAVPDSAGRISLTGLIEDPNAKLERVHLATLLRSGASLKDVSVAALLNRGVRFFGLKLKDLTDGKAKLEGLGIADLQQLERFGLRFDGTHVGHLFQAKVALGGKVSQLPREIGFERVLVNDALGLGLDLSSKADQDDFLRRGGRFSREGS